MAAIVAKSECVLNDLTPDIFEMDENSCETSKERTDFTFPVDVSYITEMQEKNNILMADIKKRILINRS
jgi:hypothetical protein